MQRLQQDITDQQAWSELVKRYGPRILLWCRKWKIQEADAQDVTQTVLFKLASKMRTFTYDPSRSFRAYLKTLTNYTLCDLYESRKHPGAAAGGSQVLDMLQSVEARADLVEEMNSAFDQEILEEAMHRVEYRVAPHTWQAFRLTAIDGLSGAAAAVQLSINVATVFKARSKVQQMLQEEIRQLESPDGHA